MKTSTRRCIASRPTTRQRMRTRKIVSIMKQLKDEITADLSALEKGELDRKNPTVRSHEGRDRGDFRPDEGHRGENGSARDLIEKSVLRNLRHRQ